MLKFKISSILTYKEKTHCIDSNYNLPAMGRRVLILKCEYLSQSICRVIVSHFLKVSGAQLIKSQRVKFEFSLKTWKAK